ncbi:MAG: glycosyltransferase [Planctomycetota bacterium]
MRTVLRIVTRLNVGGPARQIGTLTAASSSRGWRTVLVSGVEEESEGDLLGELALSGVLPIRVPTLSREVRLRSDLAAHRELRRIIREVRPDLVHTHTAKAGALGRSAARREGASAIVHTFHGHSLKGYFSPLRSKVHLMIERHLARFSDRLICVSQQDAQELAELGLGPLEVIRSGVDLAPFGDESARVRGAAMRRDWNVPRETCLIGWAGRLAPVKRVDRLLAAVSILAREKAPVAAVIAGIGPGQAALERQLADHPGLPARFVGRIDDMPAFWSAVDVAALTSDREGLPLALIEAQASGRPVVATRVGGVSEIVTDGETGFLVPAGQAPAIAAALSKLILSEGLRHRYGEAGQANAKEQFSAERLVRETFDLYERILEEKAR